MTVADELVRFGCAELKKSANPAKAPGMAAYMKTTMPCYGVLKTQRKRIEREIKRRFAVTSRTGYRKAVLGLWTKPHREEKYLAISVAALYPEWISSAQLPLYERLIREGAWWDLVDDVAIRLVGAVWAKERTVVGPMMDRWIEDEDMWIRRSALIGQLKHGQATDHRRLFRFCKLTAHENEFFIRKAIGWALRGYSHSEPQRVRRFLKGNRTLLSALSYREGAKVLQRRGLL